MIDLPSFDMNSALTPDPSHFARYSGSLTTPGCFEIVQWTVFKEPVPITAAQMEDMRTAFFTNPDNDTITDSVMTMNYRPLMPLNGRTIRVTRDWGVVEGAAQQQASLCAVLIVAMSAAYHVL